MTLDLANFRDQHPEYYGQAGVEDVARDLYTRSGAADTGETFEDYSHRAGWDTQLGKPQAQPQAEEPGYGLSDVWKDIKLSGKTIGQGLYSAAADVLPKTLAETWRGGDVPLRPEETAAGRVIGEQQKDLQRWNLPPEEADRELFGLIKAKDVQEGLQNLGYSAGSMVGGLLGGAAAGSVVPGAGSLVGAAGGALGAAMGGLGTAYRATKDQFVDNIRQWLLKQNPNLTDAQWIEAQPTINKIASRYALYEAVPEAVGDALTWGILKTPVGKIVKNVPFIKNGIARTMASAGVKLGLDLPVELGTETWTQHEQGAIEAEHGLRDQAPTWGQAFEEVAPQTSVMTLATMGLGGAAEHFRPGAIAARRDAGAISDATKAGAHADLSDADLDQAYVVANKLFQDNPSIQLRDALLELNAEQLRRRNAPLNALEEQPAPGTSQVLPTGPESPAAVPATETEQPGTEAATRADELAGMGKGGLNELAASLGIAKPGRIGREDLAAAILQAEEQARQWNAPENVDARYQEEHAAPFPTVQDQFLEGVAPAPGTASEAVQDPTRADELAGMGKSGLNDLAASLGIAKPGRIGREDLAAAILQAEEQARQWNASENVDARFQEAHAAPFPTTQDQFLEGVTPTPESPREPTRADELAGMTRLSLNELANGLGIEKPGKGKKDALISRILETEAQAEQPRAETAATEAPAQEPLAGSLAGPDTASAMPTREIPMVETGEPTAPVESPKPLAEKQPRPALVEQAPTEALPTGEIPMRAVGEVTETPAVREPISEAEAPATAAPAVEKPSPNAPVASVEAPQAPNVVAPQKQPGAASPAASTASQGSPGYRVVQEKGSTYVTTRRDNNMTVRHEVEGRVVSLDLPGFEDLQFVVHPNVQGKGWTVSEASTGLAASHSPTQNGAIDAAGEALLTVDPKTVMEGIARQVGKYGDAREGSAVAPQTRPAPAAPVETQTPVASPAPAAVTPAAPEGPRYALSLRETKHARKGHPLYVVTLDERMARPEYDQLKAAFSKEGGYWSSYKAQGAIPGIQFTDKAKAEAFLDRFGKKPVAPENPLPTQAALPNGQTPLPQQAQPAGGNTSSQSLGVNQRGQDVYADENGNRFLTENGIRIQAPVPVVPNQAGVETRPQGPEQLYRNGDHDYLTREEVSGFQKQERESVLAGPETGKPAGTEKTAAPKAKGNDHGTTDTGHPHADESALDVGLESASDLAVGERTPADVGAISGKPGRVEGSHRSQDVAVGQRPARPEEQGQTGGRGAGGDAGRGGAIERPGPKRGESAGTAAGKEGNANLEVGREPAAAKGYGIARRGVSRDHNHRIAPDDVLVPGGNAVRARANIEAIRLLKELEAADRLPTPDERKILAQFSGWGSLAEEVFKADIEQLANMFGDDIPPSVRRDYRKEALLERFDAWKRKYGELHPGIGGLLTREEWDAAKRSTLNAHYTDRQVITAMWDMVEQLGFAGGRVVEPAAGIGHFFGLMPEKLAQASDLRGVELDAVTGRLLGKLYPAADIQVTGFQDAKRMGSNTADLVISNVPFGDYPVHDKAHKDYSGWSIHNYFLARSLDVARPGGLVVAITSHYTMDTTKWGKIREYLAGKADLVGAVRLPGNAFAKNAGTEVTTDILILRKKDEHPFEGQPWRMVEKVDTPEGQAGINEYFVAHPEMVLGKHSLAGSMYGGKEYTVLPDKTRPMEKQFYEAVAHLPVDIMGDGVANQPLPSPDALGERADEGMKEGAYVLKDGHVLAVEDGRLVRPEWQEGGLAERRQAIAREYVGVKTAASDLVRTMLSEEASDADIAAGQATLARAYDAFVKKHGPFLENRSLKFLRDDVDYPNVLALEKKEERVGGGDKQAVIAKADIFTKRTLRPFTEPKTASSIEDAVKISILYRGRLDVGRIGELLAVPAVEAKRRLLETGAAYENPTTGLLETPQVYLSGNVRDKLQEAKVSAEGNQDYKRNVEALEAVQPTPKPISRIDARLGSTWIPDKTVAAFMAHLGVRQAQAVQTRTFSGEDGLSSWTVKGWLTDETRNRWTVNDTDLLRILEDSLNLKLSKAYRRVPDGDGTKREVDQNATLLVQEKQKALQAEFLKFVRETPAQAKELEALYDSNFGGQLPRQYDVPDVAHFPGAVEAVSLRDHQKRGVARGLQENTIFAHGVGAGKTYLVTTMAMEARRLGTARKPMIVVQGATLEQFASAFKRLYPAARVLAPDAEDRTRANRQRLLSQIATGDWDAVIVPHSFFNGLAISPERETAFIEEELSVLGAELKEAKADSSEKGKKSPRVKQIEKMILKREARLKSLLDARKDENIFFEDTGVDMLVVDEAHAYKRGDFVTKMDNVKGLDTDSSQRSMQLLLKSRYVMEKTGGKNVHLATGTPVSNTLAELWTMLRYIRPDLLERYHVTQFDDFASTFCATKTDIEETATGDYKPVTRFNRYQNLGELVSMWKAGADVVLAEDLDYIQDIPKIEGGRPSEISLERNPSLAEYIQHLKQWRMQWENLGGKEKRQQSHVPLLIYNLAQKAALDMRLVNPKLAEAPGGKLEAAADEIYKRYVAHADKRAAQAIFSDIYQSSDKSFNIWKDLKRKLVAKGIPAKEIAIIYDYNEKDREKLFTAVNAGDVRVVMGSTEKLGVGVNIQERLQALHHLSPPVRPMDWEQRNGRIRRQGNMFSKVEILAYGVKNTLDSVSFNILQNKQKFINQLLRGEIDGDVMENPFDDVQLSFEDMMAAFSGNPLAMERVKLEGHVRDLGRLRQAFQDEKAARIHQLNALREVQIPRLETNLKVAEASAEQLRKAFPGLKAEKFTLKDGNFDRKDFTTKLTAWYDGVKQRLEKETVGGTVAHYESVRKKFVGSVRFETGGYEVVATITPVSSRAVGADSNRSDGMANVTDVMLTGEYEVLDKKKDQLFSKNFNTPTGFVQSFNNGLESVAREPENIQNAVERAQQSAVSLEKLVEEKFSREEEFQQTSKRLRQVEAELKAAKNEDLEKAKEAGEDGEDEADGAPVMLQRAWQGSPTRGIERMARAVSESLRQGLRQVPALAGIVDIYESEADLPAAIRKRVERDGVSGQFFGAYDPDSRRMVFVSGNIPSEKAGQTAFVQGLLRHEGRHGAFDLMLGGPDGRQDFMLQASRSMPREVAKWLGRAGLESTRETRAEAAEEILATWAKDGTVHRALDRLLAKVAQWVRSIFPGLSLTKAELRQLVAQADDFVDGKGLDYVAPLGRTLAPSLAYARSEEGRDGERAVRVVSLPEQRFEAGNIAALRREARKWAVENLPGIYRNEQTGWDIEITRSRVAKQTSQREDRLHYEAMRVMPALVREAVLANTEPDRAGDPHIKAIHRLYAPLRTGEGLARVKLTVKEYADGRKLYDHSLTEMEEPARPVRDMPDGQRINEPATGSPVPGGDGQDTISVSHLLNGVKTTVRYARAGALTGVPEEPSKLKDWLRDEATAHVRSILPAVGDKFKETAVLGKILRSPEYWQHPVLKRLYEVFRDRTDRAHELLHKAFDLDGDRTILQEAKDVLKDTAQREILNDGVDYADVNEIRPEAMETWFKEHGATEATIGLWRTMRERYDMLLDARLQSYRDLIDQARKQYEAKIRRRLVAADVPAEASKTFDAAAYHKDQSLPRELRAHAETVREVVGKARKEGITIKGQLADVRFVDESGKAVMLSLAEAVERMGQLKGFYAPRLRETGEYVVRGQREREDGTVERFRAHKEWRAGAEALRAKMARDGWNMESVSRLEKLPEATQQVVKALELAKTVESAARRSAGDGVDAAMVEELVENLAEDLKARGFRAQSIRRTGRHGEAVQGYFKDAVERFARYAGNTAYGLAKMEAAGKATKTLFGTKEAPGVDIRKEREVYRLGVDYLAENLRNAEAGDRVFSLAKSLASLKYLGLNPRSALVNVSSMATSVPAALHAYALEGKGGWAKIGREVARSMWDYLGRMTGKWGGFSADEQKFLDLVRRESLDDPQFAREALSVYRDTAGKTWSWLMGKTMALFGATEQLNRGSTLLAAYRLARGAGADHATAMARARETSDRAHGVYDRATQPAWTWGTGMGSRLGQSWYVYKKYGHNYLQMIHELFAKKDWQAATYALGAPIVLGGIGSQVLTSLVKGIFAASGSDDDPEKWVYDWTRRNLGEGAEDLARFGLLGLVTGSDLHGSIGTMIDIPDTWVDVLGPMGGLGRDVLQGLGYVAGGQPGRGLEKLLPTGVSKILQAVRESEQGVSTSKNYPVFDADGKRLVPTPGESAAKALGFRPVREARARERTSEAIDEERRYTERRDGLYARFRSFALSGGKDAAERAAIVDAVTAYNRDVAEAGLSGRVSYITRATLLRQTERLAQPTKRERDRLSGGEQKPAEALTEGDIAGLDHPYYAVRRAYAQAKERYDALRADGDLTGAARVRDESRLPRLRLLVNRVQAVHDEMGKVQKSRLPEPMKTRRMEALRERERQAMDRAAQFAR